MADDQSLLGPSGAALLPELDARVAAGDSRAQLRRAELRMVQRNLQGAIDDVLAAGKALQSDRVRGPIAELLAARLLNRTLRRDAAAEVLQHARVKAGRAGPAGRLALAMTEAELTLDDKDFAAARIAYSRALPLANTDATAHERLTCLLALATIDQLTGDPDAAMEPLGQALLVAREHDDKRAIAECAFALGNLHIRRDEAEPALRLLTEAVATGALHAAVLPVALSLLARLAIADGEHALAVRLAVDAAKAGASVGNAGMFADGTILAAVAQEKSGQLPAARKTLAVGERILRERGEIKFADLVLTEIARLESNAG